MHLFNGLLNLIIERTRVTDAGHATVADDIEAEGVKTWQHPGVFEVMRHYTAAG